MAADPWYRSFFGEDYLRVHLPYLFPERTESEVIGIIRRLALPRGSAILDLACGQGRHSIPLAALGYRVTGLDLSPVLLAHAREAARDAGVTVQWMEGDMRRLPFDGDFDAVINVFNTFGYLESEADDCAVMAAAQHALKPGGQFLLETIGRDSLIRHLQPAEVDRHDDGLLVVQEQQFDLRTSRLEVRLTLIEPGRAPRDYRQSIRIYTLTELAQLLRQANLSLEGYWGGLDGSTLTLDSPRLVLLARKSKEALG